MRFTKYAAFATAAAALALAAASPASAESAKVGELRCEVSAGLGLIITSSKELACTFNSEHGRPEHYYGRIQKFGLDIGATNAGTLVWDVFSAIEGRHRGALAGNYGGADASATVGGGVGVNALVGGSNRAFTLQPLSLQGQTGLALSAGVESLTLRPGR
jgi:hypothetical protein